MDKETLFNIAPKQGTLDRDESKTFEVLFSPNKVILSFKTQTRVSPWNKFSKKISESSSYAYDWE